MIDLLDKVTCGDCLGLMRQLPSESIHFCMFSPPYWGLRDYGASVSTVWDSTGDSNLHHCEHEWIEEVTPRPNAAGGQNSLRNYNVKKSQDFPQNFQQFVDYKERATKSDFCSKCGAWRGQLGLEPTYQLYVQHMVEIGHEVRRVLRKDGSWYLNLGDTYAGGGGNSSKYARGPNTCFPQNTESLFPEVSITSKIEDVEPKCKLLIPYRVALALIDDGWTCRNDITWYKPNAMPSSVKDRLTCQTERIFHLVKSRTYYYDLDAIRVKFAESSMLRISQVLDNQDGGEKQRLYREQNIIPAGGDLKQPAKILKRFKRHIQDGTLTGKNPGDVVSASKYIGTNLENNYIGTGRNQNIELMRELGMVRSEKSTAVGMNVMGKNPGDVIEDVGDFWPVTTKPFAEAHFAVYPEALCERPIKSSCPAEVCRKCGQPRERISQPTSEYQKIIENAKWKEWDNNEPNKPRISTLWKSEKATRCSASFETIGWTDCGCGAGFDGGIVLDPMCGSGTTLVVAKKLRRHFIGFDLNPAYCDIARKRLTGVEWSLERFNGG